MNASKEEAEVAHENLKMVMKFCIESGHGRMTDYCRGIMEFIVAAQRKLPHESSYQKEKGVGK